VINVVFGQKGGIGKTLISNHVLPYLSGSRMVVEIDNNNFSSIYDNSKKIIGKSTNTSIKELEKTLNDIDYDSSDDNIIVDVGGGDDSTKVINAILEIGLDVEYWLPLSTDFETVKTLRNTRNIIGDAKTNLVFSNFTNLKIDFWFIFGSEEYGIKENLEILENFNNFYQVKNSVLFGIAKVYKTTIWDLALIHKDYELSKIKNIWRKNGREYYHKALQMHRLSVSCDNFLKGVKSSQNEIGVEV